MTHMNPSNPPNPGHGDLRTDEALLGALAAVLDGTEAVPQDAVNAAYAAVELGGLNEELAELVFDSTGDRELVAMRSVDAEARLLSFVNDHVTLDLELHADGRTLVGQMTPSGEGQLQVEQFDGTATPVETDSFGRFRVSVEPGPLRLRVVGQMVTPWITR